MIITKNHIAYLDKREAIRFAKLIEKHTDFEYNSTSVRRVQEESFKSDGSIPELKKGGVYYRLESGYGFYASELDFYKFWCGVNYRENK